MAEGTPRRIGSLEVHPAANLFPEMPEDDLRHLYESIKAFGVRVPVVLYDGRILDGRNRAKAALLAGIDPAKLPARSLDSSIDPFQYAWDMNCSRLDYSPAQKAAIRIKIDEESGALARARAAAAEKANRSRAEKAVEQHRAANPRAGEKSGPAPRDAEPKPSGPKAAASAVAHASGVSVRTVERVLKVKRDDPEAFERLATKGKLPPGHPLLAKRKPAKNWSVPRDVKAMAAFLRAHLTSHERLSLAHLLSDEADQ